MVDGGGGGPSKRTRIAMLSSSASWATVPTCMVADRPLRPVMPSFGMPHSGASAGTA
jgi:hypothetical protein